jgi:hypothetical protein
MLRLRKLLGLELERFLQDPRFNNSRIARDRPIDPKDISKISAVPAVHLFLPAEERVKKITARRIRKPAVHLPHKDLSLKLRDEVAGLLANAFQIQ